MGPAARWPGIELEDIDWHCPDRRHGKRGAASQLGLESVNVNGGVFFETQAQAQAVEALAEQMWDAPPCLC